MAGDREWATVGKVLTGVAAVSVVHRIVEPPSQVVVYSQPVIVQTQPVITQQVIVQQAPVYYQTPVIIYQPVYYRRSFWHHHY